MGASSLLVLFETGSSQEVIPNFVIRKRIQNLTPHPKVNADERDHRDGEKDERKADHIAKLEGFINKKISASLSEDHFLLGEFASLRHIIGASKRCVKYVRNCRLRRG